jgi:hypothetical protein
MARIEWINAKLKVWGAWKVRREDLALGYPKVNILLSMGGGGSSGYRDTPMHIDEIDAAQTDRAVEALRLVKSHLYLTLQYIYVQNKGVSRTAAAMGRSRAAIHAQLDQADIELARWFDDARTPAKKGFTS